MTVEERTEQVAMVAMALEKQVGGVGKSHKQEGDVCMVVVACVWRGGGQWAHAGLSFNLACPRGLLRWCSRSVGATSDGLLCGRES
jgi:hypothetical protein